MRRRIKLTESDLRNLISKSVNRILKENDEDEYDWENVDWGSADYEPDEHTKDFQNHMSWRNKEEVDANDRVMSGDLDGTFIPPEDYERANEFFRDQEASKERPDAKRHWDWGYKSALPDDLTTLTLPDGIDEYEAQATDLNSRFNESRIRRIVRESIKRSLRENEEYDWDEFEADPEGTKDLENDISWNIKDISDRKGMADTMPEELMWDEKNDMYPSHDDMGFFKDDLEPYDNGYDSIYGDRDVSDEYYGDSDYRFTHDEWNEDDPLMNLDRAFEPTSDLNRRYNESKIRRIVRESLRRASRRRR